ncbi:MAG: metallophosphoesterase [Leadbetterella sp.]|nr:metallophosphoesterase [Leadbetterella sp.]
MKSKVAFLWLLVVCQFAFSQSVVRGPYLQLRTQSSIQVRFNTSSWCNAKIKYGLSPNNLDFETPNTAGGLTHVVDILSLIPKTKYYYAIYNGAVKLEGTDQNYFITSQATGDTQKVKVWVTGDCGTTDQNNNQANVKNQFLNYIGDSYVDAWLLLGDNAYNDGTDYEYQTNFFGVYQNDRIMKQTAIYPVPGNHDYNGTTQITHEMPYYDIFANAGAGQMGGVPSMHKEYYSYNIGNVHFVALDSYGMETVNNFRLSDTLSPQVAWLKVDLAANTQKWTVVYWHHAPYTMGTHNSDTVFELIQIREKFLPILERFNVDLVLTAHSHTYERSRLIRGHFGMENTFNPSLHQLSSSSGYYDGSINSCPYEKKSDGSKKGTVYMVSGTAGNRLNFRSPTYPHDALPIIEEVHGGSLLLEVEGNRLDMKMIGSNGAVIDKFTMVKDMNQKSTIDVPLNSSSFVLKSPYKEPSVWVASQSVVPSITIDNPVGGMVFHVEDTKGCFKDTLTLNTLNPCFNERKINSLIENGSLINLKTSNKIIGASILSSNTHVILDAQNQIELLPGFETKANTIFYAKIGGCSSP